VTCSVLRPRVRDFGRTSKERDVLDAALTTLVYQEPQHAQIGLSLINEALSRHNISISSRLLETLRQLVDNSVVWLPLSGAPGRRRVVKLSYSIPLLKPVVPARRTIERRMELLWTLSTRLPEGRIEVRKTLRRMRARFTGRMGWDAIDLFLARPVLQDSCSYHLQVVAPVGLHVTELALDVEDPREPAQISDGNRHLYVRSQRPRLAETIRIKIRAERRGFMNASATSTLVLAALIWLFATHTEEVTTPPARAPAAAVLLIAPALMAVFVSRPSESALVSTTLTGIRTALGISAIASLMAAAAIAGARLTAAQPTLLACAGVATSAWLSVLVAWLGTFHIVRKHGNRLRRFWCGEPRDRRKGALGGGTLACAALAAWAALLCFNAMHMAAHPRIDVGALLAVAPPAALVWMPRRPGAPSRGITLVTKLALIAAVALAAAIAVHGLRAPVPMSTRIVALGVGGVLAGLAATATFVAELAPIESSSNWTLERR